MKTLFQSLIALLLTVQFSSALPSMVWTSPSVSGEVALVTDASKQIGIKAGTIVHLIDANGFDRKKAAGILRTLRKSGYKPERATLKKGEIVLLLDAKDVAKLKKGNSVQVTDYSLFLTDSGHLISPGACKGLVIK